MHAGAHSSRSAVCSPLALENCVTNPLQTLSAFCWMAGSRVDALVSSRGRTSSAMAAVSCILCALAGAASSLPSAMAASMVFSADGVDVLATQHQTFRADQMLSASLVRQHASTIRWNPVVLLQVRETFTSGAARVRDMVQHSWLLTRA